MFQSTPTTSTSRLWLTFIYAFIIFHNNPHPVRRNLSFRNAGHIRSNPQVYSFPPHVIIANNGNVVLEPELRFVTINPSHETELLISRFLAFRSRIFRLSPSSIFGRLASSCMLVCP